MTRLALPAFAVAFSVALPLAARAVVFPLVSCQPDITDPSSVPTVIKYVASCNDPGGIQSFACVPPSGSIFPVGITTVTCTCIDVDGNTGTCSLTVDVVGPTPTPTATATATITATATATATATITATPTASPVPQGGACSDASQCGTGKCADRVCCDTACDQPLQQCNLPGQVGTCASTAAGAPAMTPWGLFVAAGMLAGIARLALRRRLLRG